MSAILLNEDGLPINETQESSGEPSQENPVAQDSAAAEQSNGGQTEDASIPEKFRGKSAAEIARAYTELESYKGRLESEKSAKQRELEEAHAYRRQLEQNYFQQQQAAQQTREEVDPLASIDESEFQLNPREAMRKVLEVAKRDNQKIREDIVLETRARSASQRYEELKKANPDFVELEPQMQQLARELAPMMKREHINTPETVEALYNLARGRNISKYVSAATEKQTEARNLVKDEKRSAQSESARRSTSGTSKQFGEMSAAEMRKSLPVSDKD